MLNEYAQIAHQKFLARERENLRADKRLRDAAPDLLAALKDAADFIHDCDSGNPETITGWASEELLDLWTRINAAIAKAEGTA